MARDADAPNRDARSAPSNRDPRDRTAADRASLESRRAFLRKAAHFGILGAGGIFLINDVSHGALADPLSPVQPDADSPCLCNCGCTCGCTTCTCACDCQCDTCACGCDCGCLCSCDCSTCEAKCNNCLCGCGCLCTCPCSCQCDVQPLAGVSLGVFATPNAAPAAGTQTGADAGRTAIQNNDKRVSISVFDMQQDTVSKHQSTGQGTDAGSLATEEANLDDESFTSVSNTKHQSVAVQERQKGINYTTEFLRDERYESQEAALQGEGPNRVLAPSSLLRIIGVGARRQVRFCA